MHRYIKIIGALSLIAASALSTTQAHAWMSPVTTIQYLTTWNGGTSAVLFATAQAERCHYNPSTAGATAQALLSLIASAYLSGRQVQVTCSDTVTMLDGLPTRQLVRFDMKP
jgi:hypothetical protein